MPNSINWNSAEPQGAFTPADRIDEIIRTDLKQAIQERMATVTNWPANGAVLYMLEGTARIHVGDLAEFLTTTPQDATGELFYIFDTKELFVGDVGPGDPFWAKIDTAGQHALYNDELAPGTKVSIHEQPAKRLSMLAVLNCDDVGIGTLDFNELTQDTYNVSKILTITATATGQAVAFSMLPLDNKIDFFFETVRNGTSAVYLIITFRP